MRSGWITDRIKAQLARFESQTHAELFTEARRPVESVSEEHLDRLRAQMAAHHAQWRGMMEEGMS